MHFMQMQCSTEIGAMFGYFIVQLKTKNSRQQGTHKIGGKPELNDLAYALLRLGLAQTFFFSNFFDDKSVELEKSGMKVTQVYVL